MEPQVLAIQKFEGKDIQVIKLNKAEPNLWFTGEDIGKALGLSEPRKAVSKIFYRHWEELEEFSSLTNLATESTSIDTNLVPNGNTYETRIYSEEGLYLITMFARSPRAKLFRKWVINLVKLYRQGKLSLNNPDKEQRKMMHEERLFWTNPTTTVSLF